MPPVMHPSPVPGFDPPQNDEQANHGAGIYAVSGHPYTGQVAGLPSYSLIPLKYKIPTRQNTAGTAGSEQGPAARDQLGPQRQVVVRRFQFAIQLDLFLLLKLIAVVIIFNQDGSRQRLMTLLFFAGLVYLHQTGALTPLIRWLRRQAAPPQPRPVVRAENAPAAGDDNPNSPPGENQNQDGAPVQDRNQPEAGGGNGGNWWGIVREIQLFVVGFITSLLPGFHNHND